VLPVALLVVVLAAGCDGRAGTPSPADPDPGDEVTERPDVGPADDAAIRAVVAAYLGSVIVPDPPALDPESVARDVYAVWSRGKVYEGRKAFLDALQEGVDEVERLFVKLELGIENQVVRRRETTAWVYTQYKLGGELKESRGPFQRTNHTTLVLEKRDGRWQIVHELSARLSE
jgi:ketosteroid isomerase-like protein